MSRDASALWTEIFHCDNGHGDEEPLYTIHQVELYPRASSDGGRMLEERMMAEDRISSKLPS
jgi:hypothetical protein